MAYQTGLRNWRSSIKWKVLFLIFGIFIVISIVVSILSYKQAKNQVITSLEQETKSFTEMFNHELKQKENDLRAMIQFITHDVATKRAMAEGDRQFLRDKYLSLFTSILKPQYGINIFQFHKPPATSFFRVHKPNKFGDDLSRFRATVVQVNKKHLPVAGLEVGKYGASMRIVYPLSYQGEHVGSVELGSDFIQLLKIISESLNIEFAVGIKTAILNNAGFKLNTNVVEKSGEQFYAFSHEFMRKILADNDIIQSTKTVKYQDKNWVISAMPIIDFSHNQIGHLFFALDITNQMEAIRFNILQTIAFLLLTVVILSVVIYFLLTQKIFRPLLNSVSLAETIANGDLTQTLSYDQNDEIGLLINSLNEMTTSLRAIVAKLKERALTVAGAAEEFQILSKSLHESASSLNERSVSVASASDEINSKMEDVSNAAQDSTVNLEEVNNATQQMTDTISEISGNAAQARQISQQAVNSANEISNTVAELGSSANEIHQVIDVINDIAEQTNLLALNATIEAARAGEAGKGFAVVANEVKELARQTSEATESITKKIDAMQKSTKVTIQETEEITQVISKVNELVTAIAGAVEEQTVATQEIATNIGNATEKVKDVSQRVTEVGMAIQMIAEEASKLNEEARDVGDASNHANSGVGELAKMGEELKALTGKFKI